MEHRHCFRRAQKGDVRSLGICYVLFFVFVLLLFVMLGDVEDFVGCCCFGRLLE